MIDSVGIDILVPKAISVNVLVDMKVDHSFNDLAQWTLETDWSVVSYLLPASFSFPQCQNLCYLLFVWINLGDNYPVHQVSNWIS